MKEPRISQLTLGVGLKDEATFSNYFAGKNLPWVEQLKKTISGEGERIIYFYSSSGQGRTHLLQACCHEANQKRLTSVYLPLTEIQNLSPQIFEGLEALSLVCIDDVHKIAGDARWEEAFFHAFNRIYDAGGKLIMTANALPKSLNITLPDLVSRLAWGIIFQLQPLTDAEKLAALMLRSEGRGLNLSEEVGKFILTHCPRNMTTLFGALNVLDKASLAAQRKLTIPFVKEVLEI